MAKVDRAGNHYIGAYDLARPREVLLVASSFNIFLWKFLSELQAALRKGEEPPRFEPSWFREQGETYAHDAELLASEALVRWAESSSAVQREFADDLRFEFESFS